MAQNTILTPPHVCREEQLQVAPVGTSTSAASVPCHRSDPRSSGQPSPSGGVAASHSSRSVRRSTLPEGSRGMASTTTTCRRRL